MSFQNGLSCPPMLGFFFFFLFSSFGFEHHLIVFFMLKNFGSFGFFFIPLALFEHL